MKLSKWWTLALGALLTAGEAVQLQVSMSAAAHAVLSMALIGVAGVVPAISPQSFLAAIPHQVLQVASAVLGALVVAERSFALGAAWSTVVAAVLVAAWSLGVGPASPPVPTPFVPPTPAPTPAK